ncbi:MAG: AMP-binding protein [Thermodesulfobacteriota bacterium]
MIKARIQAENPAANLGSYDTTRKAFSWKEERKAYGMADSGRINIAAEAVDRWAGDPNHRDRNALLFEHDGKVITYSYADLREASCRWANLFHSQGLQPGERLFIFLPRRPETYLAMIACARMGVIFCNVFATSTYNEVEIRIGNARPAAILTHPDLAEQLPTDVMKTVRRVFLIRGPLPGAFPGEVSVEELPDRMSPDFQNRLLPRRAPLYLNYTSGATGTPKGIVHAHQDLVGMGATARFVLDLNPGTILWTESDPAWVTGTVYGAFAPWLCGATVLVQGDPLSASNIYRTLEQHKVEVWYTTPTTIRYLMEEGDDLPRRYDFSHLRHIATVGEPMVPDLFYWGRKNLGRSLYDTWWMTETGIICLANYPSMDIKPGSMGKPVPGIEVAVLDDEGEPVSSMTMGELAIRLEWPGLMCALWGDEERYEQYFRIPGWFLTGDMALMDDEGYYYHQGRTDDLIKVGGIKMIGPYEIEHVLYMHPAVAEAAVISKGGDPGSGKSSVKAFIVPNPSFSPSTRLSQEIRAFLRANLSQEIVVRDISFIEQIPKTRSGKILRRVLRAMELGLPAGQPQNLKD